MTPPLAAQALVAAVTPQADYESVAGDLCEEYNLRANASNRTCADRWYWSQALQSIPSLLSYSRSRNSLAANLGMTAAVGILLVGMLIVNEMIGKAIFAVYPHTSGLSAWPFFLAHWSAVALFGTLLAALVRSQGVRLTLITSCMLVVAIVIPIALGLSAPLTARTWLLLLGAVPAMCIGAGALQVARRWPTVR